MKFVIITGLSGAGKSQAVRFMEDLGFFCIDNMPPALIPKFVEICYQGRNKIEKVAFVIDIRGGELFNDLFESLQSIKDEGYTYEILFLEESDEVLLKLFKDIRSSHPLAPDGRIPGGIAKERELLRDVRNKASYVIDTSNLLPRQLKEQISNIFIEGKFFESLIISVSSFGFKYGIPSDSDLVFDVRFIPNPFYLEHMKKLTGKNEKVRDYVLKWEETKEFMDRIMDLLEFLIPNYIKEGKSYLAISVGCTGGRHRSVVIAEEIYCRLLEKNHKVVIEHRDMNRER